MKQTIIGLTLLLLVATAPAAAQSTNTTVTLDDALEEEAVCMPIDQNTALCDATLDDTTATLIIESDIRQSVTLTDAGGMMTGGEIRRESRLLRSGENRVEFKITRYRGRAGLTIDTGPVLFGVPLREPTTLLDRPITASDVQASAIGGASAVAVAILVMVLRAVRGTDAEPERVA